MNINENLSRVLRDGWNLKLTSDEGGELHCCLSKPKAVFPDMVFNHAVNVYGTNVMEIVADAVTEVLSKDWKPCYYHENEF